MLKNPARRPPFWATTLTVIGILILCGLGAWQLQRLAWKEGLLAQLALAGTQPPVSGAVLLADTTGGQDLAWRPAAVYGLYDTAHAFLIGPRTRDGAAGYHLIIPLQIAEDDAPPATLLVNRGWVPAMPEELPAGFLTVHGLLRLPESTNKFVPPNDPGSNQWFRIDIAQIATAMSLQNTLPYVLYAAGEDPVDPVMTVGGAYHDAGGPALANNHRGYAFFWFAMAGVLAVIYALRFLRR